MPFISRILARIRMKSNTALSLALRFFTFYSAVAETVWTKISSQACRELQLWILTVRLFKLDNATIHKSLLIMNYVQCMIQKTGPKYIIYDLQRLDELRAVYDTKDRAKIYYLRFTTTQVNSHHGRHIGLLSWQLISRKGDLVRVLFLWLYIVFRNSVNLQAG